MCSSDLAVVKLKNGEVQAAYLTQDEVDATKARSKSSKSDFSPWKSDWESMAKKTAIRRLYNLLPKTPEISAAREVLAEEDAQDRSDVALDVTPPAGQGAVALKDKLRKAAGKPPAPPDQTLEPGHDPPAMDEPPAGFEEPGSAG